MAVTAFGVVALDFVGGMGSLFGGSNDIDANSSHDLGSSAIALSNFWMDPHCIRQTVFSLYIVRGHVRSGGDKSQQKMACLEKSNEKRPFFVITQQSTKQCESSKATTTSILDCYHEEWNR